MASAYLALLLVLPDEAQQQNSRKGDDDDDDEEAERAREKESKLSPFHRVKVGPAIHTRLTC